MTRVGQVMWVLDHLPDLESDLSRFHRIDEIDELDGPKFFRLAWRVSTYGGVIAMRLEQQNAQRPPEPSPAPERRVTVSAAPQPRTEARAGAKPLAAFAASFPDLIERKRVS